MDGLILPQSTNKREIIMWKYIEEINWSELSKVKRGYELGKRYMLENFTQKRCKEIDAFVRERHNELYKRIEEFERANDTHCGDYGGDDSFGDMIHHVIGLGETKFNEIMEDPSKLNGMDFVESFSYVMPYDDDFLLMNPDAHTDRAMGAMVELVRILKDNKPSGDDVRTLKELMNRFMLMLAGDFKEACQDFDHNNDYNRYYNFESNDCHAMFANYISDCKKFMDFIS